MIDLQEPQRHIYSDEEKLVLKEQFLVLLHTLLLVYLGLHNFIIPLVSNFLTGRDIRSDMHFWFLFQIPVQILLRQKRAIPGWYFFLLVGGSLARLITEVLLMTNLKSWGLLSVLLSEISSFIFYFLYYPQLKEKKLALISLSGLLLAPSLSVLEVRSMAKGISPERKETHAQDLNPGCQGSQVKLRYPLQSAPVEHTANIGECGFFKNKITVNKDLSIRNATTQHVNLRLYKLQVLHGRVKWRFKRLIQVPSGSIIPVGHLIENDVAYLLKSPERRKLGTLVILPRDQSTFPIGEGELSLTYDTLKWSPHE